MTSNHKFYYFLLVFFISAFSFTIPLQGRQKIKAAVLKDFPPLYMTDAKGMSYGLAIDILENIALRCDFEIVYLQTENWAELLKAVQSGKADLSPAVGMSEDRFDDFIFSKEIETIPVSIFIRSKNNEIKGRNDLKNHRVAIIEKAGVENTLLKDKEIQLVRFPNLETAVGHLLSGDVDAFVFPEPVLLKKLREMKIENLIQTAGEPVIELKRGFLLKKSDSPLLSKINLAIEDYRTSGAFLNDYIKWYGKEEPFWNAARVFLAMSLLLITVILGSFVIYFFKLKNMNKKLQNSERKYRLLFETASDAVLIIDSETGKIVNANSQAEKLFGYPIHELIGMNHFNLYHLESMETLVKIFSQEFP